MCNLQSTTRCERGYIENFFSPVIKMVALLKFFFKHRIEAEQLDQYQYLGNCPPAPPLTQQQSIDNKLGLMLG